MYIKNFVKCFVLFSFIFLTHSNCIADRCKLDTYEDAILWVGLGKPSEFDSTTIKAGSRKELILSEGVSLTEEIANNGSALHQEILAGYYTHFVGDFRKGLYWARRAVLKGSGVSMEILAKAYTHGNGVVTDHNEAIKWLLLGASCGNENCSNIIKEFQQKFPQSELLLEGQRRAQIWERENPDAFFCPY